MNSAQWFCFEPDRESGWSSDDFSRFVKDAVWIFARTMPENPHEYILKKNIDAERFEAAVRFIRAHGTMEEFQSKPYKILYHDGHKYLTMGAELQATILINRKPLLSPVIQL